jgi:hypothetical protein
MVPGSGSIVENSYHQRRTVAIESCVEPEVVILENDFAITYYRLKFRTLSVRRISRKVIRASEEENTQIVDSVSQGDHLDIFLDADSS